MIYKPLSRRTVLRGIGTAIALPALEAMAPAGAFAAEQAKAARKAPLRMAFLYVPNGKHMPSWRPASEGPLADLPYTLQPLKNVKDHVLVMSGLTHDKARPNGDGPGDHARAVAAFLTGVQPKKTSGADIKAGISIDQLAARYIGKHTKFASLELGCERGAQAGNCDSGYSCAYSSNISWQSESTPVAKEVDPRLVFERLFGNGDSAEMDESAERRLRYRQSILDMVMDDASSLKAKLGARDLRKLDEYFTGIREIEKRLELAGKESPDLVKGVNKPAGIPESYQEHIHLMADMMALAFQGDLTRVSTFMLANDGSNRPYRNLEIPEGHHDLSHHQGDPEKHKKLQEINKFHVTQLAYLLEKLKSIPEGDGALLDNCMIVYGCAISDGNRHNHDDLPILLAGKGGGAIKTGRHVVYPQNTPMTNLYLNMLDRLGLNVDKFGDSTGKLDKLI
jgi:hypothetical protein